MRPGLLLLACAALVACKDPQPPAEPPFPEGVPPRVALEGFDGGPLVSDGAAPSLEREPLTAVGVGPDGGATPGAPRSDSSVVIALRERKLDVAAARSPAHRIAFARDRIAVLTGTELVVRNLDGFGVIARRAVEDPRRVLVAADGSLVVLAARASHRVTAKPPAWETHGPLPVFADTVVLGDRLSADRLWVKHPFGTALYGYRLGSGTSSGLALEAELRLDGHDGRAITGLRDGSFAYTASGRLHHVFPHGRRLETPARVAEDRIWRLLPARRIDQLWAAREDGHVELVQVAPGFATVRTLELGRAAFDLDAGEQHLAFVTVDQGDGRPRRWRLSVLDFTGKPALEVDLPPDSVEPRGPDWVRDLTQDRHVVLSGSAPLVAVGGPSWLGVWNVKSGASVYAGPP